MDNETEQQAVDVLREAINAAVRAGLSISLVRTVVADQLSGIAHLGNGGVDQMLKVTSEIDEETKRKYNQ